MYASKTNYGLSGAGVLMIRNYLGLMHPDARDDFPINVYASKALKAFKGTGSFDSPDTDILKGIIQEFGKDTVLCLTYPEEK